MSTFILHKAFGFGYVTKNNQSTIEVKFPFDAQRSDGEISTRVLTFDKTGKFYSFIEPKVVDKIYTLLLNYQTDRVYDARGHKYANLNLIKNFAYNEKTNQITCKVYGTYAYDVLIDINKNNFTCNCPVNDYTCKHLSAVKELLFFQLYALELAGYFDNNDKFNLDDAKKSINNYLKNPYSLELIRQFLDDLYYARRLKTIESYLIYLGTIKPGDMTQDCLLMILDLICVISKLSKDKFIGYLNEINDPFVKHSLLDEYERILVSNPAKNVTYKSTFEVSFPYMMIKLLYDYDESRALYFYMRHTEFREDLRSSKLFDSLMRGVIESEDEGTNVLYTLLNRQTSNSKEKEILLPYIQNAPIDSIPSIAKFIPYSLYFLLDLTFLIKIFPYLEHKPSALTIIQDHFSELNDEQINALGGALALTFSELSANHVTQKFLSNIHEISKKMPKSIILDSLLDDKLLLHDFQDPKDLDDESLTVMDDYFKGVIDKNDYLDFEDKNFFRYFKISMFVSPLNMPWYYDSACTFDVEYRINDVYGREIFYLVVVYSSNDEIRYRYQSYAEHLFKNKGLLYWFLNYAEQNNPVSMRKIEDNKDELISIANQKVDNELLEKFESIEKESLDKISQKLSSQAQINIELHFVGWDYSDNNLLFSIKVGNTRMYQVPSAYNFLVYFDRNEYHRYGKNLAFYHNRDNLTDQAKKIFDILNLYSKTDIENAKYFIFSKSNFIKMMDALKNNVIYYLETPYISSLDPIDDRVVLDENYKVNFYSQNKCSYFKVNNCLYAFDETNKIIRFTDDYSKVVLIDFAHDYAGFSLKRVKKDFLKKVYPIVQKDLEISDKLSDEFKLSDLKIQSYFDFVDNSVVTLKTKYLKNDEEISADDITILNDLVKKNQYLSLMNKLGFNESGIIENPDQVLDFLSLDFSEIQKLTDIYLSETLTNKQLVKFNPPHAKMTFTNNLMSVFFEGSDYTDEELYEILSAIKKHKKYVLLKSNHIITFDDSNANEFLDLVESLNLDKKHLREENFEPVYQSLAAFNHVDLIDLDSHLEKMVNDIKNFKTYDCKMPQVLADVRPYQKEGFKWLHILSSYQLGGILADDMGLGKTLEIIMLLASDKTNEPSLIVAPKSLVFNWYSEFNKFLPDYEVQMIYGDANERAEIEKNISPDKRICYLTSYDTLRNDIDNITSKFNYLVLDEAQVIKNVHALKSQMVKRIEATHRFALTGTPIENDIFDLWSIFDFLMPNYMPNLSVMKSNANEIGFQETIAKRVAPFILRRTKREVLKDLPQKFERVITAEMTVEQRKLYDATCLKANQVLNDGGKAFDVLYLLTRLRQICVDPNTFVENYKGTSGKTEMLKTLIKDYINEGHRILIFSQFVTALNIIKDYLENEGIKYYVITGKTDAKERVELVDSFNSDSEIKVFLISLKAGGNGLNLVGADTVIHYDPWWNIAAENQATDRAYRIGQKRNVEVIRLIAANSIEQRVIELQNKKKDLIDRLISDDTSSIEKVTLDDLKFILQ